MPYELDEHLFDAALLAIERGRAFVIHVADDQAPPRGAR